MKTKTDSHVDDYIEKSAEFAQPILRRLRKIVHQACPGAEEAMRWGHPSFLTDGKILTIFAGFKAHCGLVFWHREMKKELADRGLIARDAMGHIGRIEKMSDLPDDATLLRLFRVAAALNASGKPARPPTAIKRRPAPPVPKNLAAAMKTNAAAAKTFKNLAPSHRREYIEWINEAKREETRKARLAKTVALLAEGKSRHWKYAAG